MNKEWAQLVNIIVARTGWGPVSEWQGGDFRKLNQLIFDKTRVNISESTLRRLFGKSDYPHIPNETTLNTLAVYAGYADWRDFKSRQAKKPQRRVLLTKRGVFAICITSGLMLMAIVFYRFSSSKPVALTGYSFTSMPVTRSIPNSVIFHYKAPAHTAQLSIQQSWDDRTRVKVASDSDTYTSVYYRPGFFQAKLIAGDKVVKEHPLLIPTDGWLGMILNSPQPYYLKPADFTRQDELTVTPQTFAAHGFKIELELLRSEFYNVGNFKPVPVADVDFTAMMKSDTTTGAFACKKMQVFLVTNGMPISINLCDKGCVSTLRFFNGKALVSGQTTDLSGFGVELGTWVKTEIKSNSGKLQFLVNDHFAYETSLPASLSKILGVAFGFDDSGAVKNIQLRDRDSVVFQDR